MNTSNWEYGYELTEAEAEELYELPGAVQIISIATQVEPGQAHTLPDAGHAISRRNGEHYFLEMSNESEPDQIGTVMYIGSHIEEYELARYISKWIWEEKLASNFALYRHFRPEPFGENADAIATLKDLLWVYPTGLTEKQIDYIDELLTSNDYHYRNIVDFLAHPDKFEYEELYVSAVQELSLAPIFDFEERDEN